MSNSFRFGTVGSPLATPKKPGGSVGATHYLKTLSLNALELGWVKSVRVSEETCLQIKQAAADQEVAISVHAPYYINLNAEAEEWPKSRQRLMDAARYGFLAGATDIVFHPGSYFEKPPQEVLPIAIERLKACMDELRQDGNPVILRPETMGKSAMLGSLDDTLAMSCSVPGVEPCLDFAHLHARPGDGSVNTPQEWEDLLDNYAKALGEASLQRLHIHLSGIEYSEKGERNHVPIDESELDIRGLFGVLKKYHCSGRILCESPVLEDDAVKLKQLWASLV